MASSTADPFVQRYLEIQALKPTQDNNGLNDPPPSSFMLTLPIMFVIILFIGVFGWQFYRRLKELNRLLILLVIGLIAGSIPLTVNLLNTRSTEIETKARYDYTPQTIMVTTVAKTSFTISWKTKVPTIGAIKTAASVDMKSGVLVEREAQTSLTHTITVPNLKPNTTYYVELFSDSLWYNNNGQPIIIKTLSR